MYKLKIDIEVISEFLGVPEYKVQYYIDSGRLPLTGDAIEDFKLLARLYVSKELISNEINETL